MLEYESRAAAEPPPVMPVGVAPPPPPPALFELRPLSTGEILDRTFSLYRRRFWLYAGLASIAAAITTIGTFVRLTWGLVPPTGEAPTAIQSMRMLSVSGGSAVVTSLFYILAYAVTQAATVAAVFALYLGHETSIGQALQQVRRRWYRYILIALWQGWSAVWLPCVLAIPAVIFIAVQTLNLRWLGITFAVLAGLSVFYGPFAYLRNSLGIVASVVEDLKVRRAMRRSKELVAGRKGRVFALFLLMYVLSLVAGVAQGVFAVFLTQAHAGARVALEALTLLTTFVTGAMVTPVGAIAFCLFYIDERVRREGFDVEVLMDRALGPAGPRDGLEESPFRGAQDASGAADVGGNAAWRGQEFS